MASLELKLCGLRESVHVDAAIRAGATHIGLVRFPRSPRHVSLDEGTALARQAGGRAKVVVVTVDATDDEIARIVDWIAPDMIQLHGRETPERVADVRRSTGLPVIKASAIRDADDLTRSMAYATVADALLLDARPPEGSNLPGGNGVGFDWRLLEGFAPDVPWFLSGGLRAENVVAAATTAASGLDLSSGIEDAPGQKSIARIEAVGRALRAVRDDRP